MVDTHDKILINALKKINIKLLSTWDKVFFLTIKPVDKVFQVSEWTIQWMGINPNEEHWFIELYYQVLHNEVTTNINILGSIFDNELDAKKALIDFISKQIEPIKEHTIALKKQLTNNAKTIAEFEKIL